MDDSPNLERRGALNRIARIETGKARRVERNGFSPSSLDAVWFDLELRVAGIPATRFFYATTP
jgi:hypothetical protein